MHQLKQPKIVTIPALEVAQKSTVDTSFREKEYYPWLDMLRAVCFLMVFINHFGLHFNVWYIPGMSRAGVSIFFAISGWLITKVIEKSINSSNFLSNFYSRRLIRIYPLYLITLGIYTGLLFLTPLKNTPSFNIFRNELPLFATFNYGLFKGNDGVFAHAWSIAVEERFYMLWPALCLLCIRTKFPFAVLFTVGLLLMSGGLLAIPPIMPSSWAPILPASLIYGCMLAIYDKHFRNINPNNIILILISVISFGGLMVSGNLLGSMYHPLASLFSVILIWASIQLPSKVPPLFKPAIKLGELSYSTYLIHMFPLYACGMVIKHFQVPISGLGWIVVMLFALGLTIMTAYTLYHLIEKPLNSIRNKITKNPTIRFILANIQFWLIPVGLATWFIFK